MVFEALNTNSSSSAKSLLEGFTVQPCTFAIASAPILKGDTDLDGQLTPRDALWALRLFLGTLTGATPDQEHAADVDNDGQVTPRDALFILQGFLPPPPTGHRRQVQ